MDVLLLARRLYTPDAHGLMQQFPATPERGQHISTGPFPRASIYPSLGPRAAAVPRPARRPPGLGPEPIVQRGPPLPASWRLGPQPEDEPQ